MTKTRRQPLHVRLCRVVQTFVSREPVLCLTGLLAALDALTAGTDVRQAVLLGVAAVIRSRVSPAVKP